MADYTEALLRALLTTAGRSAFTHDDMCAVIDPTGHGAKQIRAFNLADGTRSQTQIAKQLKINSGNFSRTVGRWVERGILFRLGDGRDATLLHVYPIPAKRPKAK